MTGNSREFRAGEAVPEAATEADEVLDFEHIYSQYFDFVWRSALRLGAGDAVAEDIAQEVFVVVHQRLDSFEGRSSVKSWVFGILRMVMRNHRRAVARRRDKHDKAQVDPTQPTVAGPDSELRHRSAQQLLYSILNELDEPRREVFVLAELEQMPQVDIAELLSLNVNTVYSRLRAARQQVMQAAARRRAADAWRHS